MATTDSNGIVFLEETDPISPFHTTINTLQQGTSDALSGIKDGSNDILVIHQVADTSERAALAVAYGPTASKPLYVNRANAGAGKEMEYTTDGSTWRTVAATPNWKAYTPSWTNLTVGNGTVTARWMVMAGMVEVELKFVLGSTSAVGSPPYFSLPAEALPAAQYGTLDLIGHAFYAHGSSVWQGAVTRSGSFARCHLSGGGAPGGSSPFAWASGDVLSARLRYAGA